MRGKIFNIVVTSTLATFGLSIVAAPPDLQWINSAAKVAKEYTGSRSAVAFAVQKLETFFVFRFLHKLSRFLPVASLQPFGWF